MNQRVGWPVAVVLFALLAAGLYAYYRYVFAPGPPTINVSSEIPPKQPGDDKPATPPPGVRVPGQIKR
ncbi:MAG: hypothetical protein GX446_09880 [Chthonomonadales bacterium]|nr:hypothetical protein [Chthonomonadales bacterium]